MPTSIVIFLLATLPIAQTPYAPTPGEPASPKPNRRILAPEYGTPHFSKCRTARPPHPTGRRTAVRCLRLSIRSMAGRSAIMA